MPPSALGAFVDAVSSRYRVERELGRGGWGIVYLADDLAHARQVAIKVLNVELAGSANRGRFLREIEISARLHHPHIVSLLDSGEVEGSLYYVMPYVAGETLRQRLSAERQLPIREALHLALEVAQALAFAHAAGVVHRDIKPANILISDGHALLADFGVARAITSVASPEWITSSGMQVGTPLYMSPEQASGSADIDGRSDIYALGCVMYEMIAGGPPFAGSTAEAVVARHVTDAVPPIRTGRRSVPHAVEEVVYKALAKSPADRFQSADELVHALEAAEQAPLTSELAIPGRSRRASWLGAGALALLLAAGGAVAVARNAAAAAEARSVAATDTTRLVVFPFEGSRGAPQQPAVDEAIRRALLRWQGLEVVDPNALSEVEGSRASEPMSASAARTIAMRLRAGRYVRGSVAPDGPRARVLARLFDVSHPGAPLAEATELVAPGGAPLDSALALLTDRLLLRDADLGVPAERTVGTASLPARQALLRARAAFQRWNLPAADSAFAEATRFDPRYAAGSLGLALARAWAGKDTATWYFAVEAAAAARDRLSERERGEADAMLALVRGNRPEACAAWDALARRSPTDFSAWYGAATCLARDRVVLPDSRSPSGWRFRSGYHSALERYRRAFALNPLVLSALRDDEFLAVRRLLWTSGNFGRGGMSLPPNPTPFVATPSLDHDTLAFVPFPVALVQTGDPATMRRIPHTGHAASQRQRLLFRDIATTWVTSSPRSAEAREGLALAMYLLGSPQAIDTLMRAKELARDAAERFRVAGTEVWMRVQLGMPGDTSSLRRARSLADSLLGAARGSSADPNTLASLAVLTGHAFRADEVERGVPPDRSIGDAPAPALSLGASLLTFAALGGPADTLRALEQRAESLITAAVPRNQRESIRSEVLGRAAALAFPDFQLRAVKSLAPGGNLLLLADAALLRGDTAAVRRSLASIRRVRLSADWTELELEAVYPEAWLLAETGNAAGAAAWLDPTLTSLRVSAAMIDPVRAGALVRAAAYRAQLAVKLGDAKTAARWAGAVVLLWSGADEFLQPLVARMRRLVK